MYDDIKKYKDTINSVLYADKKENEIIVSGEGKVMISCPHSVFHYRNGIKKCAEEDTAILAYLLHNELNIPYMYKIISDSEDANYDIKSTYKNNLVEYIKTNNIKVLLDLHELNKNREEVVNLGTGYGKNIKNNDILNILIREISLKKIGMISIDKPFSASGASVISTYVHAKCDIDCIQVEINSGFFINDIKNFEIFSNIMQSSIKEIEQIFNGK